MVGCPETFSMGWWQKLLFKQVMWLSSSVSSRRAPARVYRELSDLLDCIVEGNTKKGLRIPYDASKDRFIIFSDQHKGAKNGADDFMLCEPNYLAALDHYFQQGYFFI